MGVDLCSDVRAQSQVYVKCVASHRVSMGAKSSMLILGIKGC